MMQMQLKFLVGENNSENQSGSEWFREKQE